MTNIQETIIDQVKAQFASAFDFLALGCTIFLGPKNSVQFNSAELKRNILIAYNEGTDDYTVHTYDKKTNKADTSLSIYCDQLGNFFTV